MGDKSLVPTERIEGMILFVRGERVMLDADLARLYGVRTKNLVKAVGRNKERFPKDFAFRLDNKEVRNLRFQIGTSSSWGGRRYLPYVFTEEGVAMLSSVLRSKRAAQVNITIMRAFVKLRRIVENNKELARKIDELDKRVGDHDRAITVLIEEIRKLTTPPEKSRRRIGFR